VVWYFDQVVCSVSAGHSVFYCFCVKDECQKLNFFITAWLSFSCWFCLLRLLMGNFFMVSVCFPFSVVSAKFIVFSMGPIVWFVSRIF